MFESANKRQPIELASDSCRRQVRSIRTAGGRATKRGSKKEKKVAGVISSARLAGSGRVFLEN